MCCQSWRHRPRADRAAGHINRCQALAMTLTRLGYTLLLYALLPRALLHLWWRARRQTEYLEHVGERFGRYATAAQAPLIWVHAVSVGETRAAAPLIQELQRRYPQHRI